ncbi:MAG: lytic transglycosylase domain-containing protein [Deltaproteobacteria bacterium]|jgi:hypothetical protein|nr:lytic transglycosylase domain-containing protein [Deltaproteobacteria bacterium]
MIKSKPLFKALFVSIISVGLWNSCTPIENPQDVVNQIQKPLEAVKNNLVKPEPLNRLKELKIDYSMPSQVFLCGQRLPLERPAVYERLEKEFILAVNHRAQVELWRRRALRYFPLIEKALMQAGLPEDLKYLAVAESDLRPTVSSPAGATGIWQFIPGTARRFGLKVDKFQDQRMLPEPLLNIGLQYLTSLRHRFGDWSLAMAAYNAGEARIAKTMSQQGLSDYWSLSLPTETERYVYRIAAIKLVLEGAPLYGFNDRPEPGLYQPPAFKEKTMLFKEPTAWTELAVQVGTDYKSLRRLNPHLASQSPLKGGPYIIRLPAKTKTSS